MTAWKNIVHRKYKNETVMLQSGTKPDKHHCFVFYVFTVFTESISGAGSPRF